MTHPLLARLLALLLVLAPALARAQIEAGTAEALMHASGLWNQLADMAPQVEAGFANASAPKASPADIERLSHLARAAFAPERLRTLTRSALARELDARHVDALFEWYRSPAGQRIRRAEEAASADTTDSEQAYQADIRLLEALPPARRALVKQLVDASATVEAMVTISLEMAVAIQTGVERADPSGPVTSPEAMIAALSSQRAQMAQGFEAYANATMARVYADCPDATAAAYVQFLRTPAGRHFTQVGTRALAAALRASAHAFGEGIVASRDQTAL